MITTERLTVVPFEAAHARDYFEGFNENVTRYQWPDPFEGPDAAREALCETAREPHALFLSILSREGRFLGGAEVHGLDGDCLETGAWIREPDQGRGYAFEALTAVLAHARREYGKRSFFYEADIRNAPSLRLLQKLEGEYIIETLDTATLTTPSGKTIRLRGHILKVDTDIQSK